jgi:hypothetical protein
MYYIRSPYYGRQLFCISAYRALSGGFIKGNDFQLSTSVYIELRALMNRYMNFTSQVFNPAACLPIFSASAA